MDSPSPLRENIDASLQRDPAARTSLEVFLTSPGVHALAWHCGCVVGEGGGERWALQKFKEWPAGVARQEAFDAIVEAHERDSASRVLEWGESGDEQEGAA